ncbi:MAG: cytochrome c [Rhodobacteraceae bacterium]|nr:cytochrome c [Paracoccaceae bacterium]
MRALTTYAGATLPALLVLGFFVWFANWIPQTRWDPPKVRQIDAGATPGELAVMGQAIVRERGCMSCHTIEPGGGIKGQGRGPNLDALAVRRANGVAGGPETLVGYLTQALYAPGAYLVEGFSNIMPSSVKAPAKLNRAEVSAVVAYLESLGGTPSVTLASLPAPPDAGAAPVAAPPEAVPNDPEAMLDAFDCLGCHSLEAGEVLVGPPFQASLLVAAAAKAGADPVAYVMQAIVDPRAFEDAEFPAETMPDDYGERLNAAQLYAITEYLITQEGGQ